VILTDAELRPGGPEIDHCGSCRACLDICPTAAFPAPYQLDARRCISYLTIEHHGPIAFEFRKAIGNRIYGCDDCLAICPWNKFASVAAEAKLQARDDLRGPKLASLLVLNDETFRKHFSASPIKRIGRERFLRNVLIAAGNSGDQDLVVPVTALLNDPSPLVRGVAVWALSQLIKPDQFLETIGNQNSSLSIAHRGERDHMVLGEWSAAMQSTGKAAAPDSAHQRPSNEAG
jgi:epoxyqueuosine reductase